MPISTFISMNGINRQTGGTVIVGPSSSARNTNTINGMNMGANLYSSLLAWHWPSATHPGGAKGWQGRPKHLQRSGAPGKGAKRQWDQPGRRRTTRQGKKAWLWWGSMLAGAPKFRNRLKAGRMLGNLLNGTHSRFQ